MEECRNNKTNFMCCFIDLKKLFDTMFIINFWDRLKELKIPFELRVVMRILYENVICEFSNTES
jgi:hypothetical protein